MKCLECGNELNGNSKFCKYCGKPVISNFGQVQKMEFEDISQGVMNSIQCKGCGKMVASNHQFCIYCGMPLMIEINSEQTLHNKQKQKNAKAKKSKKCFLVGILFIILLLVVMGVIYFVKGTGEDRKLQEIVQSVDREKSEKNNIESIDNDNLEDNENLKEDMSNFEIGMISENYDTSYWDERFASLPVEVTQQYYVIFYEGTRNDRIELAAFDVEGNLNGNYIVWSKQGDVLELYDNSVIKNCTQFYYNGSTWIKISEDNYRMSNFATKVVSSNLDIRDKEGNMVLEHITASGIAVPIDETHIDNIISDYVLVDSDKRYIVKSELNGFTAEQCRLARNEVYARHGRKFDDEQLQNYFNALNWYTPMIESADFDESILNEYERKNLDLIVEYEKEKGYRQ